MEMTLRFKGFNSPPRKNGDRQRSNELLMKTKSGVFHLGYYDFFSKCFCVDDSWFCGDESWGDDGVEIWAELE